MGKFVITICASLSVILLLSGCIAFGGGTRTVNSNATVGQQLVDLKKAKDAGAISETECQSQKSKLLGTN